MGVDGGAGAGLEAGSGRGSGVCPTCGRSLPYVYPAAAGPGFALYMAPSLRKWRTESWSTALSAAGEYDRGDIIAQKSFEICYPKKISELMEEVCGLYCELMVSLIQGIVDGKTLWYTTG